MIATLTACKRKQSTCDTSGPQHNAIANDNDNKQYTIQAQFEQAHTVRALLSTAAEYNCINRNDRIYTIFP